MLAMLVLVVLLVLPSLNMMRVKSRRTTCLNNLRVTALGVISYQTDRSDAVLPAMAQAPVQFVGAPNQRDVTVVSWSWQALILPYMGTDEIFERLKPDRQTAADVLEQACQESGQSQGNTLRQVLQQPLFVCPSDQGPRLNELRSFSAPKNASDNKIPVLRVARGNYVGVNALGSATHFVNLDPAKYPDIPTPNAGVFEAINKPVFWSAITDGTANTFMLGERAYRYEADGRIYEAAAATQLLNRATGIRFGVGSSDTSAASNYGKGINFPHEDPLQARWTYSSLHPGGANFAFCDGRYEFLTETIDPITMMALTDKSDVEVLEQE